MKRAVVVIAAGKMGAPVTILEKREQVIPQLLGGGLAHMADLAFRGGAKCVIAVRANQATAARLNLGDLCLTTRVRGRIAEAVQVRRAEECLELRNPLLSSTVEVYEEQGDALLAALNESRFVIPQGFPSVTAAPLALSPRLFPEWTRLEGGDEGEVDWNRALEALVQVTEGNASTGFLANQSQHPLNARPRGMEEALPDIGAVTIGTDDPDIINEVVTRFAAPLYAGPRAHASKAALIEAATALAAACPRARVVGNMPVDYDLTTRAVGNYPAYYLAAYVAGLRVARKRRGDKMTLELPALTYLLNDDDEAALAKVGVLVARADDQRESPWDAENRRRFVLASF